MTKINVKEKPDFGFQYNLTICEDKNLKEAIEQIFKRKIDLAELRLGHYAKEALEAIKQFGAQLGRQHCHNNLVPNVLRYDFAKMIIGETVTPTFEANYVALGDDATTVAYADEQLGNETLRGVFDDRSAAFHQSFLDKFFGSSGVGGNSYYEIGIFVDGTASIDTGYLFSHVNINEVLAATESLTINATFSITDS